MVTRQTLPETLVHPLQSLKPAPPNVEEAVSVT